MGRRKARLSIRMFWDGTCRPTRKTIGNDVPPRGVVERGSEASRIRRAGQGIPSAIPRRHMARCVRGSAVRTRVIPWLTRRAFRLRPPRVRLQDMTAPWAIQNEKRYNFFLCKQSFVFSQFRRLRSTEIEARGKFLSYLFYKLTDIRK